MDSSWMLAGAQLEFSVLHSPGLPMERRVPPTIKMHLAMSVCTIKLITHGRAQRPISQGILGSVELTINFLMHTVVIIWTHASVGVSRCLVSLLNSEQEQERQLLPLLILPKAPPQRRPMFMGWLQKEVISLVLCLNSTFTLRNVPPQ